MFDLKLLQEVHYLRPDGHVERGYRLIQYDELWTQGERPCNCDPLPLATAKLVWVPICVAGVESHFLQQGEYLGPEFGLGEPAVGGQGFWPPRLSTRFSGEGSGEG